MSDVMGREFTYLSSHATNRYFIPNWGNNIWFYTFCNEAKIIIISHKTHYFVTFIFLYTNPPLPPQVNNCKKFIVCV